MIFKKEKDFEDALVNLLFDKGWENKVIEYPTEEDLIQNWADILFQNNKEKDRLNDCPLTDTEMNQIMAKVAQYETPINLNGFINGKTVSLKRDNPDDILHLGQVVSLKIYDRHEIAAGQSRYQIVRQPKFKTNRILNDRRGDIMLLINGMPVIHIELKRSGVPVSDAYHQIEKYAHEGVFTGLFSLVQIFVAMEPNETVYFANPGPRGMFNRDFYFHWADFNNMPINKWDKIASSLLSIPMAHQLIGFYTVADRADNILKVMRSYQYFAASKISDKVTNHDWTSGNQLGGYIFHTTGSGKTMTSFKSAQLISNSGDADKVLFLVDRIELGTQSLKEYRAFADESETVQETENTDDLIRKLKSDNYEDRLIVTSIQKMSHMNKIINEYDLEKIRRYRTVFIIDEAHRSTFGEMLADIKRLLPDALFFGFTGTPIVEENMKKGNTTSSIIGDELHRYSIADGIRDKNVLGFDTYKVLTFQDIDLKKAVGLEKAKASTEAEALADKEKEKIYRKFVQELKMAGYYDKNGNYVKGIEDYIPTSQYESDEHRDAVVNDIIKNWALLSRNSKFHAILATSSISEAIEYYRLFKVKAPKLKVTAIFEPTIDNGGDSSIDKEDGLVEIIEDYEKRYNKHGQYSISKFSKMKKDIANRLGHKERYIRLKKEETIDLLIVVDQMLTGFDSKWINTLYLDKILYNENLIQAYSRTNRLFGIEKPFGTIKYYRKPHTMERLTKEAVKLYSGDKAFGLFADHLCENIENMNKNYREIKEIFESCGINGFLTLPEDESACKKFAKEFGKLNRYLEAAIIQGFVFDKLEYENKETNEKATLEFDEFVYNILVARYRDIGKSGGGGRKPGDLGYDIDSNLSTVAADKIDVDYMQTNFDKYIKSIKSNVSAEELEKIENELHKSFGLLSKAEQKQASIILHEIQSGDLYIEEGKTLMEYISERLYDERDKQINDIIEALGVDEGKLRHLMSLKPTLETINEYGRFEELKVTMDDEKVKNYYDNLTEKSNLLFMCTIKAYKLLRNFIVQDGFNIDEMDYEKQEE